MQRLFVAIVFSLICPSQLWADAAAVERGKLLYTQKICVTCHSLDGSKLIGPTIKGLYGKKGKFVDGKEYVADEVYLKESILNPMAHVVEGYPPAMPPGLVTDPKEIADLIAYIKTIK